MKTIQKCITKQNRQIEFKNIWLLYNFNRYTDFFWTKKQAWEEAYRNNFDKDDTKKIYQVLRGDIKITIDHDPFFQPKPSKKKRMEKVYYCDNCGKKVDWRKGAFQCGVNKKGKIGTWCNNKCYLN